MPQPVIVADFNHDGIPDVLVPSTTAPTATIAFGSVPFGTLSSGAKAVTFPVGCLSAAAGSIQVGDFNGDGFPDIVFFCGFTAGTGGVMLGNGDGTFQTALPLTNVFSNVAVLGDFNHDGKLDLVVLGPSSNDGSATELHQGFQFFSGNNDGTFAGPVFTSVVAGATYSSPVAADLNQDGYPDLVVGAFSSTTAAPTINVFGNNKDGTFGATAGGASSPNTSAQVGTLGTSIDKAILTGSFSALGSVDLAVPDTGATPGIFFVKNTSTATAFTLAPAVESAYPALQSAVAGSFTGTGFTDLAAANGTSITVLANDGLGDFGAIYTALILPTTSTVFALADANGDGHSDVYTASNTSGSLQLSVNLVNGSASALSQPVSLTLGTKAISATWPGNAVFAGSSASGTQTVLGDASTVTVTSNDNPAKVGDPVTLTAAVVPVGTSTLPTGSVTLSDGGTVLGSGTLTAGIFAVTTNTLSAGTHAIVASYSGDANFALAVSPPFPQVVNAVFIPPASTTALAVTFGDGAVTTVPSGSVLTLTATVVAGTTLVSPGQVRFCDATAATCTDIHLLGTAQLTPAGVATLRFIPGPGTHSYKAVFLGTTTVAASASAPAALNVTATLPTTTTIAQSGSVGNYTLTATVVGTGSATALTGSVSFLDASNGNAVLGTAPVGAGSGVPTLTNSATPATGNNPVFVTSGDFNNDGKPDLVTANAFSNSFTVLLGNADGTFSAGASSPGTGNYPDYIAVGDFNADGNQDLAISNFESGGVTVLLGHGDGTFTPTDGGPVTGANPRSIVTGDFNGDGKLDLAVAMDATATIFLGNGDGTFAPGVTFTTGNGPNFGLAVGDLNGDGFLDLLTTNFNDNTLSVFLGNGDGTFQAATATPTGTGPEALVLGDFDGDGKLDVAVTNQTSSDVTILMGVGNGTFLAKPTTTAGTFPRDPGVGDFNGDGKLDLAIANSTSNSVTLLLGNGDGTFTAAATPATGAQPSWIAVGDFNGDGFSDAATINLAANTATILLTQFTNTVTAAATGIAPIGGGPHQVAASYPGDTLYAASTSSPTSINGLAITPSLTWIPTVPAISYGTPLSAAQQDAVATGLGGSALPGTYVYTPAPGTILAPGTQTLNVTFTPTDTVTYTAATASASIVVGRATPTATLTSSLNPATAGNAVTFTAQLAFAASGTQVPTGTVTFVDGTTPLGTGTLGAGGMATFTTSSLAAGSHSVQAMYGGDSFFSAANSARLSQVVNTAATGATLISSKNPATAGDAVTFTAAVTPVGAAARVPTGNVTFVDGTTPLGTGVLGPAGAATFTTSTLAVGTHAVQALYAGDTFFAAASSNVLAEVVNHAAPVAPTLTWATPAAIAYGVPLTAAQLDATATGSGGSALTGTFTYTPAAGTILPPGTQTLTVSFAPTDTADYTAATASVQLVVSGLNLVSFTPSTANLGDADKVITLTGSGFVLSSIAQVNGAGIATTYVSNTTLMATVPAADFAKLGTLQISVFDPPIGTTSSALPLTVTPPPPQVTVSAPATTPPGSQPAVSLTITNPYPIDLTVTITLSFAGAANPPVDDPAIQFSGGGRTLSFVVPANSTAVPPIQLQAGTDAGTITIPLLFTAGGVDVTPTTLTPVVIVIPAAVPSVSTTTITRNGTQLSVAIHGFSNTREVTTATFHFTPVAGKDIATPDVTAPVTALFDGWFGSTESVAFGSTFTYTQIFNVSDDAANVGSVEVTLTNSVGVSTTQTAQ